jgi:hypothetical protein
MQRPKRELNRTYTIFGSGAWGGCSAIQSKLMEYGVCSYTGWAPGPPNWRFLFDTYLTPVEIQAMLGDLWNRYEVRLKE